MKWNWIIPSQWMSLKKCVVVLCGHLKKSENWLFMLLSEGRASKTTYTYDLNGNMKTAAYPNEAVVMYTQKTQ